MSPPTISVKNACVPRGGGPRSWCWAGDGHLVASTGSGRASGRRRTTGRLPWATVGGACWTWRPTHLTSCMHSHKAHASPRNHHLWSIQQPTDEAREEEDVPWWRGKNHPYRLWGFFPRREWGNRPKSFSLLRTTITVCGDNKASNTQLGVEVGPTDLELWLGTPCNNNGTYNNSFADPARGPGLTWPDFGPSTLAVGRMWL